MGPRDRVDGVGANTSGTTSDFELHPCWDSLLPVLASRGDAAALAATIQAVNDLSTKICGTALVSHGQLEGMAVVVVVVVGMKESQLGPLLRLRTVERVESLRES